MQSLSELEHLTVKFHEGQLLPKGRLGVRQDTSREALWFIDEVRKCEVSTLV